MPATKASEVMKELLVLAVILAVVFVVLNALTGAFSGTLSTSWSSGINTAASFIGPILIVALAGVTLAIVTYAMSASNHK